MKIAIMQPYLFPYIGYFQLINSVDFFGIGDDVQFIKAGWIHRNRILANHEPSMFTFSIKKDSSRKIIKERYYNTTFDQDKEKLFRILNTYYRKAPFFKDVIQLIESVFEFGNTNISEFNKNQLITICDYLEIKTTFIDSTLWQVQNSIGMRVEERAIRKLEKLKKLGVNHFINPIGGVELYTKDFFNENEFKLSFLKTNDVVYQQLGKEFVPHLSIIDVMMFNSVKEIENLLNEYVLQ